MKTYMMLESTSRGKKDNAAPIIDWHIEYAGLDRDYLGGKHRACPENISAGHIVECVDVAIDCDTGEIELARWPSGSRFTGKEAAVQTNYLLKLCGMPPFFVEEYSPDGPELVPAAK